MRPFVLLTDTQAATFRINFKDSNTDGWFIVVDSNFVLSPSRKHTYIILTPLNPIFI